MLNQIPTYINLKDVEAFLGTDDYLSEVSSLMDNNEAQQELNRNMKPKQLFKWSIKYNLLGFCKYLYIKKQIPCSLKDFKSTTDFNKTQLDSKEQASLSNSALVESGDSNNTSCNIELLDKNSIDKQKITNFLYNMRRYSSYKFQRGCGGKWIFNKKYNNYFISC
jgi:hypothetical protein